jgi:hypothetical protein
MTSHVRGAFERVGLTYNPRPDVVPNSRIAACTSRCTIG